MNALCNTLLPNDRAIANLADIGKIIKPKPVIDRVIEVEFAPILTVVSTDSIIVFRTLKILNFFFDLWVFSSKYVVVYFM